MTRRDDRSCSSRANASATGQGREVDHPERFLPTNSNAYRTLIEQIPAATHLSRLDETSSTVYISPQIAGMTGYGPNEWIVDRHLWTRLLHPEDCDRVMAAHRRHTATGEPFSEEYRLIARDGSTVWIKEESRVLLDEHGAKIASQGIMVDITDHKRLAEQLRESLELRRRLTDELAGAKAQTGTEALLAALNARDGYTGEHSQAVVNLVKRVARRLGLSEREVTIATKVAFLHDVGKIGVPDSVLRKPGPLNAHEWRVMREHPIIGARIVTSIPSLAELAPAIRAEHERWDGNGYPDGLAGESIPLASRIVFVCDAYHAMISQRPYRKALPDVHARDQLQKNAGTQFDPTVVKALLAELEEEGPLERGVIEVDAAAIRVLLVDDDESTRMLLRFTLEAEGTFEVIGEAGDGAEALAMVRSEQPHAVVIDLAMPVMGGLEAIPAIRQSSPSTRIVVFTASDAPGVLNDALRLGADICLGKGASLTEVATVLEALCKPDRAPTNS
jgi:PAS domain S-box-containing protein